MILYNNIIATKNISLQFCLVHGSNNNMHILKDGLPVLDGQPFIVLDGIQFPHFIGVIIFLTYKRENVFISLDVVCSFRMTLSFHLFNNIGGVFFAVSTCVILLPLL